MALEQAKVPTFAVVGHPNKGKSSIVATLAEDDRVGISDTPGTTTKALRYPLRLDGEVLYELVDTPGFQRARRVLDWLEANAPSADQRAEAVAAFVAAHRGGDRYADECELLKPLLEGAGILYVVDGSRPYGPEYEAEMEILRWTGAPRMALINMIGAGDHVTDWRRVLDQYFSVVRVFDAMAADFDKRLELLESFGHLRDSWRVPVRHAVDALRQERARRATRSAVAIAELLADSLTMTASRDIAAEDDADQYKEALQARLTDDLKRREREARDAVQRIYLHPQLRKEAGDEEASLAAFDDDLFAERTWQVFGLSRTQLMTTAAAGGAIVGGGIDLLLGGASLFLGAGIGAVVGAGSVLFGGEQLAEFRILGLKVGGYELTVGPVKNRNFPWVLLGRAWLHQRAVSERNHARRDGLLLDASEQEHLTDSIDMSVRRALESSFERIRRAGVAEREDRDRLRDAIEKLL